MSNKNKKVYILLSLLLFLIEAIIAIFFRDSFIRPIVGDYLVVILLYCMLHSISSLSFKKAALTVLIFAYAVEFLQWINILEVLGLQKSMFTHLTLGSTFDWGDMLAYTLGITTVLVVENLVRASPEP
ncbi:MAG: DUF2809 domain-containing protein [Aureispira sp.]|nr:DUF2809 domain-containing protein [Aureispira sp.]